MASSESVVGILCCWDKAIFETLECVSEQRFITVKDQWTGGIGPKGLICIHAPNDATERAAFFESVTRFVLRWGCQSFVI